MLSIMLDDAYEGEAFEFESSVHEPKGGKKPIGFLRARVTHMRNTREGWELVGREGEITLMFYKGTVGLRQLAAVASELADKLEEIGRGGAEILAGEAT